MRGAAVCLPSQLGSAYPSTDARTTWVVSSLAVGVVPRIPPVELFHPPCGIDQLLPAGPPRMTCGADGDAEMWDRRACGIGCATRAYDRGLAIRGMNSSLHILLL